MSEFKQLIEQSEFLERRANHTYRRILEKITEVKDHSGQKGRPGLPFRTTENSAEELARLLLSWANDRKDIRRLRRRIARY